MQSNTKLSASTVKRALPLLIIALLAALTFIFDLHHQLSFSNLASHHSQLIAWVQESLMLSSTSYLLLYIAVVALSLPGGLVMTLSGGFLFGPLLGGTLAVIGATTGATLLFLIAKTSLGDWLLAKAGDRIQAMQQGFANDAFNYLLVLRLVPLFPFFLVNLAPAFLGVRLRTYVLATIIGITPATYIFSLAGSGLGTIFDQGGSFSPSTILTPQVIAALVGLALLALIPIIYRRIHKESAA